MLNIWYVDRDGDHWSPPRAAGEPFNPMKSMFISMTNDGTIYTTDITGGPGREHLAKTVRSEGGYGRLRGLGRAIGAVDGDKYPHAAPDGSYLIWSRMLASGPTLVISFKESEGSWSEPRLVKDGFPRAGTPFVSWDGKYLFFTAGDRGRGDIYWVDASALGR